MDSLTLTLSSPFVLSVAKRSRRTRSVQMFPFSHSLHGHSERR